VRTCSYCGRENNEAVPACRECGTQVSPVEAVHLSSRSVRSTPIVIVLFALVPLAVAVVTMPASMSSLYPDWFVPAVILVGVTQLAFALLAFKTSRVLSCAFVVLTGSQILAAVYIVTAPSHVPGAADLEVRI
jgi:hypothetical protein